MSKFHVGDVIVRVWGNFGNAVRGEQYKVSEIVGSSSLQVEGDNQNIYAVDGFEPAPCVGAGSTTPKDLVDSPAHYDFFPDLEAIQVIARAMTQEQFYGYCLGNRLKYRLRAGKKDALEQDIAKSDKYTELYEQHKHLCHS